MSFSKPKVLLFFTYRRAAEGLDEFNLSKLFEDCDVDIMFGSDRPDEFASQPVKSAFEISKWRYIIWYFLFYSRFLPHLKQFDRDWFGAAHLYKGLPSRVERAIRLLWTLRLLAPVAALLRWVVARDNLAAGLLEPKYDLLVAYTGIKDPRYDEVARWARRHGIPVMVVPINWDNLSSKAFVEPPDFLGVWGEQAQYFARGYHHVPIEKTFVLGAARFEPHYRVPTSNKTELRRRLGLPLHGRMMLFAGSGADFDELPLLNDLDAAISAGRFPSDIRVVFKSHPKRHRGPIETDSSYRPFENVILWQPKDGEFGDEENSLLLAASDAIISPYSTMVLEAAYFGIPALNMFYNDAGHHRADWDIYGRHPSMIPVFAAPWNIECRSRASFVDQVEDLLKLIGNPRVDEAARATFAHCVHIDSRSYGQRLSEAIRAAIAGDSAVAVTAQAARIELSIPFGDQRRSIRRV